MKRNKTAGAAAESGPDLRPAGGAPPPPPRNGRSGDGPARDGRPPRPPPGNSGALCYGKFGPAERPHRYGAAKLLADNDADFAQAEAGTYEGTLLRYEVTLGADPANDIVPKLINGELDLAAVPTNLAASLYNKTQGGVKLLALNTLGVLHILENGESVHSMADLAGKTLYATGQGANPEYVLHYLLEQNGLTPGRDVTIEWKTSDELTTLMASGEIGLCMLPVPAATSVMLQNADVRDAVDLNDAWAGSGARGTFTMGCLVGRTEWWRRTASW